MKLTNMQRGKILWFLTLVVVISTLPIAYLVVQGEHVGRFTFFPLVASPLIIILHAIWKLGLKRGLGLLLISSVTGFIFEYFGLKYGGLFGGYYEYLGNPPAFLTVPVHVIIYWAVFIYIGYSITSGILEVAGISKPHIPFKKQLILLLLVVLLDGLIVTAIDILMDPLAVEMQVWRWLGSGPYFDIPMGNFMGWFTVACISTGIFRLYEFFRPANQDRMAFGAEFVPTVAYFNNLVVFSAYANRESLNDLLLIGIFVMLPIVLVSSILYFGSAISQRSYYYDR